MARPPATAFRLDSETDADILYLADRLRTTKSGAVREAVRKLAEAERRAEKKSGTKSPHGIDSGNTRE
jgi:predicted transcriptional regulator